jgi:hypothetical protein
LIRFLRVINAEKDHSELAFSPFGLKVYDWMAGVLLAFTSFREEAVDVVVLGGGKFVFNPPDFAQDKIALSGWLFSFFKCVRHSSVNSSGVASTGRVKPCSSA